MADTLNFFSSALNEIGNTDEIPDGKNIGADKISNLKSLDLKEANENISDNLLPIEMHSLLLNQTNSQAEGRQENLDDFAIKSGESWKQLINIPNLFSDNDILDGLNQEAKFESFDYPIINNSNKPILSSGSADIDLPNSLQDILRSANVPQNSENSNSKSENYFAHSNGIMSKHNEIKLSNFPGTKVANDNWDYVNSEVEIYERNKFRRKRNSESSNSSFSSAEVSQNIFAQVAANVSKMNKSLCSVSSGSYDQDKSGEQSLKRKKFLERNRLAASKCRLKKKLWTQDLEMNARLSIQQSKQLRMTIAQLEDELSRLRSLLLAHQGCDCAGVCEYLQHGGLSKIFNDIPRELNQNFMNLFSSTNNSSSHI